MLAIKVSSTYFLNNQQGFRVACSSYTHRERPGGVWVELDDCKESGQGDMPSVVSDSVVLSWWAWKDDGPVA